MTAVAALLVLAQVAAEGAPTVELSVATATLVLGVDQEVELRIAVGGEGPGTVETPRVRASAGRVEGLVRSGPREFTGRYLLPPERFPQAAILVAEVPLPAGTVRGSLILPLRAAASPAFRTDPGARVTLRIGDKEFGPQTAPKDGLVRISVVVPPGASFGVARSVNAYGKATEQTVDLKLPPFRRILVVAPETLPAGDTAEVGVYAVEPSGAPAPSGSVLLRAAAVGGRAVPRPQALGGPPGEARFLVRAPAALTTRALQLEALLRDQPSTAILTDLPLVPGRPARLALRPDRPRLPIGVGSAMRVYLAAEDRFGNAADAGAAAVVVDGERIDTRTVEDGRVVAVVPAPQRYDGRDRLEVEAALGQTYARQTIPLGNLPAPIRQRPGPPEPPRLQLTPRVGFVWGLRQAPGPAAQVEVLGRRDSWPARLLVGLSIGVLGTEIVAEDGAGLSRVALRQVPALLVGRLRHRAGPRLALAAGAGLGVAWAHARVPSYGFEVSGTALGPAGALDLEAAIAAATGEIVVGVRFLYARLGRLSSGDRVLGNTAGLLGDVGYRLTW